jgi:hypothetical protein
VLRQVHPDFPAGDADIERKPVLESMLPLLGESELLVPRGGGVGVGNAHDRCEIFGHTPSLSQGSLQDWFLRRLSHMVSATIPATATPATPKTETFQTARESMSDGLRL